MDPTERSFQVASSAHDAHNEHWRAMRELSSKFRLATINIAILINGAGAVAVLGLIGSLIEKDQDYGQYKIVLLILAIGIFCAAVAAAYGYFSSVAGADALAEKKASYEYPYLHENEKSGALLSRASRLAKIACGLVLLSIVCFLVAAIAFSSGKDITP